MSLYQRLLGIDANNPKIPIHQFQALTALWAKGNITGPQAQAGCALVSGGAGLTAGEITEMTTLVGTVPVGTTAVIKADRALRLMHIDQCLLIADSGISPLNTEAGLKAAIGGV